MFSMSVYRWCLGILCRYIRCTCYLQDSIYSYQITVCTNITKHLQPTNMQYAVMPLYNTVAGRHLLGPPYRRGALRDFAGRFIRHRYPKATNHQKLINRLKLVKLILEANWYGQKLDTQTASSAQNRNDNGSQKQMARAECKSISNTFIGCLHFAARTKRHRSPFARQLFGSVRIV